MINLKEVKASIEFKAPKIVIYGTSGIGKSTFAAQVPNPIVADIESGMDLINVPKQKTKSFQDMTELLKALNTQDHDFKYLIVDSIDWLERIMIKHLCDTYGAKTLYDPKCRDFSYGRGEKLLMTLWDQLINGMNAINQNKNMGIILIAHNQITKFHDPLTESYDKHSIKLEKKSCELIKEWAECLLFADLKVTIEEEDVGFKKTINRGKELGRVLYTEKRPAFEAKNRYKLPPEIELSWKTFNNHVEKYYQSLTKGNNEKYYQGLTKGNNAPISETHVKEIREMIERTATNEEIFIVAAISNLKVKPIGDKKLENMPDAAFDGMKKLLERKEQNMSTHN